VCELFRIRKFLIHVSPRASGKEARGRPDSSKPTDVGINCDWIRGRDQGLLEKHVVEIPAGRTIARQYPVTINHG